ncbi:DNA primase/helicase [Vibrio phage 1.233.A._10N.261.51.E6]|nr:DNA primase/helicase [Vibrio phage 1.233.A._10N.261.51.E6]AUR96920.1 DNA primase/helicase [Vibrio phage 1.233.B._10N.261.51.E6]
MKTIQAVIGKWSMVFEHYDLPPITGKRHFKGEAPCCGRKGKFRIDDKNGSGSFICACGEAGNGWKLLQIATGMEFKDLAKEVDSIIGNAYTHQPKQEQVEKPKANSAVSRFKSANPIRRGNVQAYLNGRGIFDLPSRAVKESSGNMFAIAADVKGNPCYSHETFLDGDKKANVEVQKKMIGLQPESHIEHAESIAVRLFDVSSTLGIAEGIETALSCKQIYKCNTWSTLNSSFMKKFRAPTGVKHLMIFADNDKNGTGLAAAFECGNRNILAKNDVNQVTIRWPGDVEDFNDMLINGSQVFEWKLTR